MKDILKFIIYIFLVISMTLICCIIFLKPDVLDFKNISEFQNVQKNRNNIEEIIVKTVTLLGNHCYKLDIEEAYNFLNNIEIKKKSNVRCMDSDMYLEFYFKDGSSEEFYFECENFVFDDMRYELKEEIMFFNKDEYMPDRITETTIVISNEDKIDCK